MDLLRQHEVGALERLRVGAGRHAEQRVRIAARRAAAPSRGSRRRSVSSSSTSSSSAASSSAVGFGSVEIVTEARAARSGRAARWRTPRSGPRASGRTRPRGWPVEAVRDTVGVGTRRRHRRRGRGRRLAGQQQRADRAQPRDDRDRRARSGARSRAGPRAASARRRSATARSTPPGPTAALSGSNPGLTRSFCASNQSRRSRPAPYSRREPITPSREPSARRMTYSSIALRDVQPVLGLLPRERARSVEHVAGDLLAAVRRQAVQHDRVGRGAARAARRRCSSRRTRAAARRLVLLPHRRPDVGRQHVRARRGLARIRGQRDRAAGRAAAARRARRCTSCGSGA